MARLKETTDDLEKNNIQIDAYNNPSEEEMLDRLTQKYYDAISQQDSSTEDVSEESLDADRVDYKKLARLLAALEIIDQYNELERVAE